MNTVEVGITREFLRVGKEGDCYKCPVALGLAAAGFVQPIVGGYTFSCLDIPGGGAPEKGDIRNGKRVSLSGLSFLLPDAVMLLIRAFDRGEEVEPYTFEVRLDEGCVAYWGGK